ncbi:MAG TPA: GGDEF domain-containing protein [Sphaerochaeta sp.]|nr:GGDEF domain-containing protein [Sphaerochaeta sp.]
MKIKQKCRIAFLFNDFHSEYSIAICKGALQAAEDLGVTVVFFGVGQLECPVFHTVKRNKLFSLVSPESFDGIIYISSSILNYVGMDRFLDFIKKYGDIPSAHIGMKTSLHTTFNIDNRLGMYTVVEHLIKVHNRKKIAFIKGSPGVYEADERFTAYKNALTDNGIEFDDHYVFDGYFNRESGILAIEEFLDTRKIDFDALVGANDLMALYAMKELQQRGYRIPEDISICGFDDLVSAKSYRPALTTVHQPAEELGYMALKEFSNNLITGSAEVRDYQLPSQLVIRQSCGCSIEDSSIPVSTSAESQVSGIMEREFNSFLNVMARNIIGSFNEDDIRKVLAETLKLFSIGNFFLAKYIDDNNCQVFYDYKNESRKIVPSKQCISDNFDVHPTACSRFVLPLYYKDEDIGFFISDAGSKDFHVLEVLGDHLSGALKGAQLLNDAHKSSELLEKEVELRTKELAQRSSELEVALEEVQLASNRLKLLAVVDDLTGLFNRRGFLTLARQNIELSKRNGSDVMLVFLDLDGLKQINDNYGHHIGDIAIQAMATILQKVFRKSDIIARLGGDEFTVLAIDCTVKEYHLIMKRMNELVEDYNTNSLNKFTLAVSSGAAPYNTKNQLSVEDLLQEADRELYKVKKEKKKREKEEKLKRVVSQTK